MIYKSSNNTVSSTPGLLAQGLNPQYLRVNHIIISSTSPILNSGPHISITHYVSSNIRLLPSAAWHRLTTFRRPLSILHIMDSGPLTNCTQRPRSRISPACSTSSPAVSPAHQCACPTTFTSKYKSILFENNKFRQVI